MADNVILSYDVVVLVARQRGTIWVTVSQPFWIQLAETVVHHTAHWACLMQQVMIPNGEAMVQMTLLQLVGVGRLLRQPHRIHFHNCALRGRRLKHQLKVATKQIRNEAGPGFEEPLSGTTFKAGCGLEDSKISKNHLEPNEVRRGDWSHRTCFGVLRISSYGS